MNPFIVQLRSLTNLLSVTKTKYAILGGIAVALYGEPRLTADVDVNIALRKEEIERFIGTAKKYGFYPASSDVHLLAKNTGVIPMEFSKGTVTGRCDIIIAENSIEEAGIRRAKLKKIGSIRCKVVSPEDLIIHKITSSRPRDKEDLKGILIRQKGKLDIRYIRSWLKKISLVDKKSRLSRTFDRMLKRAG
ncbi:MAG: nucleotidyltransferase [Candidatus Omnitrophota bacterium]